MILSWWKEFGSRPIQKIISLLTAYQIENYEQINQNKPFGEVGVIRSEAERGDSGLNSIGVAANVFLLSFTTIQ